MSFVPENPIVYEGPFGRPSPVLLRLNRPRNLP